MADLPPNVTLAQLSYFVTVAEELNLTRAAERLHASHAPPLSQAIRALETGLGVTPLIRTSRHVELDGGRGGVAAGLRAPRSERSSTQSGLPGRRGPENSRSYASDSSPTGPAR